MSSICFGSKSLPFDHSIPAIFMPGFKTLELSELCFLPIWPVFLIFTYHLTNSPKPAPLRGESVLETLYQSLPISSADSLCSGFDFATSLAYFAQRPLVGCF